MKTRNATKRETMVLSGFGAALALMAGAVSAEQAQKLTVRPEQKLQHVSPAIVAKTLRPDALCKLKDEKCLTSKSYVKTLKAPQMKELKVLIARGVQTDIKDACLVC